MSAPRLIGFGLIAAVCLMPLAWSEPQAPLPFSKPVLGASLFRAPWAFKNDRAWLESQLEWLKKHRFDAIRVFGVVGDPANPDYWDGREIDWRWKDYAEVIAGTTDLAYDKYGLRVQWTIFADAQKNTPGAGDRSALVDRFIAMSRGREAKILAFEVANEFWQNGFDGDEGIRQLESFARRLKEKTSVPVAASAHAEPLCRIYAPGPVDFAPVHFDRTSPTARWTPLVQPWRIARQAGQLAPCELPRWASNNEPLGPGSSLSQPLTPLNIAMSAVNTYLAGIPIYMFHAGPGVRDDPTHPQGLRPSRLDQMPGAEGYFAALAALKTYIPDDLPTWTSVAGDDERFPFLVRGNTSAVLGAISGGRFVVAISGMNGAVHAVARRPVDVRSVDPLTGATIDTRRLKPGETIPVIPEAAVLIGSQALAP